jgi:lipid A ethanolaminephosphotransferase
VSAGRRRLRVAAGLTLVGLGILLLEGLLDGFDFPRELRYQLARRDVPGALRNAAVYAGVYGLCLAGLAVLLGHARRAVRLVGYALLVVSVTAELGFRSANGYGFTYHEASLLWGAPDFVGDALVFFVGSWSWPLLASLAGVVAFERLAVPRLARTRSLLLLLLPLAALVLNARLLEATNSKLYQTPLAYRVPLLAHYAWKFRTLYLGPRAEPELAPVAAPLAEHLVLVVDESVRGDLLGLNGAPYETTPRLETLGPGLFNYGIASAPSNLSASTNLVLQSGLRPDQIPDRELASLKGPNLFAYLARAGFDPWLIDAQIYSDRPTNFMTRYDLEGLAGHVQVRRQHAGLREWEMDFAALEQVVEIVSSHERSFVYLVKTGAHFPYEDKYPDALRLYRPTLGLGEARRAGPEVLNSYLNALRWTVDAFLAEAAARLEATGRRVLLVYTSDHGQSGLLPEELAGTPSFPHATPVDPPPTQAMVPLLLLAVGADVRAALASRYHPELRDRVSGFEIFPTLLVAAGYAEPEVAARHLPSLFDAGADRSHRVFVSGNLFGRGRSYDNRQVRRVSEAFLNPFELPGRGKAR